MAELSETAGELIDTLKEKGFDKETVVGIMLFLKTEENYLTMLEWVKDKSGVTEEQIYEKISEILD